MKNNPQDYLNHILNRSASKETHRFGKAQRFQKNSRLQTQVKYQIPSMFSKRSCSFGYGQKSSIIGDRASPPPALKKKICTSPSFAKSRDSVNFGSYLFQVQKKSKNLPSPSKYDIKLPKNHIGGRISNRSETQSEIKYKKQLPGPGTYNLEKIAMANSSSFILSNYKNSISPKYHQNKVQIKQKAKQPFVYESMEHAFGKSTISKFKNVSVASFSKSKRASLVDKQKAKIPSFKYNHFSQFGQRYK